MGLDNPLHIAFLLIILLLVFGAKRLPEMGKSLGSGLRGFKETLSSEPPVADSQPTQVGPAAPRTPDAGVDERTSPTVGGDLAA